MALQVRYRCGTPELNVSSSVGANNRMLGYFDQLGLVAVDHRGGECPASATARRVASRHHGRWRQTDRHRFGGRL
jgi:hypothetical protein